MTQLFLIIKGGTHELKNMFTNLKLFVTSLINIIKLVLSDRSEIQLMLGIQVSSAVYNKLMLAPIIKMSHS